MRVTFFFFFFFFRFSVLNLFNFITCLFSGIWVCGCYLKVPFLSFGAYVLVRLFCSLQMFGKHESFRKLFSVDLAWVLKL